MRILVSIILLGIVGCVNAQTKTFSKKPNEFIKEFKTSIFTKCTDEQKEDLEKFQIFWDGGTLNKAQKEKTIASIQLLKDKKQKAIPTFLQVANVLQYAHGILNARSSQLDSLLNIFEYSFTNYSPNEIKFLLKTLENYTKENLLYEGKTHNIYTTGGNFDFKLLKVVEEVYDDYSFEEEPEEEESFDDNFDNWDEESSDDDWGTSWEDEETLEEEEEFQEEGELSDELVDAIYAGEEESIDDGPIITFADANLLISTSYDTVNIQSFTGELRLTDGKVVGSQAEFDWTSVGLSKQVKAKFGNFSFNISKPEINAEDVLMSYPEKIDEEVKGIFQFKTSRRKKDTYSSFPRFMSYSNKVKLKGFGDEIEYIGGFALNGNRIFSSCVSGAPSTIIVSDSGIVKFKSQARYFEFNDSMITSNLSRVILYIAEDSITHPGTKLFFDKQHKKLRLRKDQGNFKEAPFENSFHQLDMDVDAINWTFSDTVITMVMVGAKNEVPAFYDSQLSFSETKYIRLKSIFPFHPLQMIMNYAKKKKTKDFLSEDIARYYKQKPYAVKTAMISLSKKGFVKFNNETGEASLTEKAFHYYKSRRQKKDYDIISVKSLGPKGNNSILNLNNNDLIVDGVDKVVLSDSNDVLFFPKDRRIIFQENRNMLFDGIVQTSNYVFNGRDFKFDYDSFLLKLDNIDSIEFSIEVTDSVTGKKVRQKVDNKLTYSRGTLTIDKTTNKSGVEKNPRYPHFDANDGALVAFNKKDILNGVYDTSFRYEIPPFAVDSLSGDIENTLSFDGEFHSGGVFPAIKQKLDVQDDLGFGFTHQVPEEGYPLYGGEARFFGTVTMGKNGLRGGGKIVFLNTILESMDFVFYKDSVKGLGDIANTIAGTHPEAEVGVTFPQCQVSDYEMSWYPRKDSMHITNYENAFHLFDDEVEINGALVITSKGMKGIGLVETQGSLTISKNISFKERSFTATEGQFEILSTIVGKPALRSDYVNVDLDLDARKAVFSPAKEGFASNDFPFLKYRTSLNDGVWDMEKRIVKMEKPIELDISESYFYSTKKSQDSLAFNAEKATYIIDSLKLLVEGVESIAVADAKIFPDGSKLEIKENAKITALENAVVIMDTLNEYHTLRNTNIIINSKNDFDGSGYYQFVNYEGGTLLLEFSEFQLEKVKNEDRVELHTVSRGILAEEDKFYIAPKMLFKGEVTMQAHRKLLSMDGFIKLDLKGKVESARWLKHKTKEEDDDIRIDLDAQDEQLISGVHFSESKRNYYCTFLGETRDEDDQTMFSSCLLYTSPSPRD